VREREREREEETRETEGPGSLSAVIVRLDRERGPGGWQRLVLALGFQ
jgi:hypothetical protein